MFDPKSLEAAFKQYMPLTTKVFEEMWRTDRKELVEVLDEFMKGFGDNNFMYPYFQDLQYYAKTAQHKYTNPWEVL